MLSISVFHLIVNRVTAHAQAQGPRLCFRQHRGGLLPYPEAFRVFIQPVHFPWGNPVHLASSLSLLVWSQLVPESCPSVHEHAPSVLGAQLLPVHEQLVILAANRHLGSLGPQGCDLLSFL